MRVLAKDGSSVVGSEPGKSQGEAARWELVNWQRRSLSFLIPGDHPAQVDFKARTREDQENRTRMTLTPGTLMSSFHVVCYSENPLWWAWLGNLGLRVSHEESETRRDLWLVGIHHY